jgi:hypothetical protein
MSESKINDIPIGMAVACMCGCEQLYTNIIALLVHVYRVETPYNQQCPLLCGRWYSSVSNARRHAYGTPKCNGKQQRTTNKQSKKQAAARARAARHMPTLIEPSTVDQPSSTTQPINEPIETSTTNDDRKRTTTDIVNELAWTHPSSITDITMTLPLVPIAEPTTTTDPACAAGSADDNNDDATSTERPKKKPKQTLNERKIVAKYITPIYDPATNCYDWSRDLYVSDSTIPNIGSGLFAARDLPVGTAIIYSGVPRVRSKVPITKQTHLIQAYSGTNDDEHVLDGRTTDGSVAMNGYAIAHMANHCAQSNARTNGEISETKCRIVDINHDKRTITITAGPPAIKLIKRVPKNGEIFVDYGSSYKWLLSPVHSFIHIL